eukprot:CAMPEP_0119043218 /NCGR_PEP_ID=MMETSP1177-20130426/19554_1 /TAXON_ID=2985 /ORGANISM="Ochromonas sp, Strain CCMP1899" /LENGTH=294 /DNA_ID=CAMNT_0007010883 /DNA_START=328 /DNA_END=1211 /DNA_ORIENTATION=+
MLNVAVLEFATDLPVNVHAFQDMKEKVAPVQHVLTHAPDMAHAAYIENLPYGAVANDFNNTMFLASDPQDPKTFSYNSWDDHKSRACICDPEWGEVDCSSRICPYANDVMDVRNNLLVTGKFQVQEILLVPSGGVSTTDAFQGKTIALTFKSKLNETYTTRPLLIDVSSQAQIHAFALSVQLELMRLPNMVIDKVAVTAFLNLNLYISVTFTGNSVQGPQHLLTVKDNTCGDGCTPQLVGPLLAYGKQKVYEQQASDYNSYECGRRGKCNYASGVCGCFAGYTGVACNVITALV